MAGGLTYDPTDGDEEAEAEQNPFVGMQAWQVGGRSLGQRGHAVSTKELGAYCREQA
jgi:hypothetical protein